MTTNFAREGRDVSASFDHKYYLARYSDVADAKVDPLVHYCDQGWREGRDPSNEFDTKYYLASNKDVANAGINPFWHYVVAGKAEGRAGRPRSPHTRRQLGVAWSESLAIERQATSTTLGAAQLLTETELVSRLMASIDTPIVISVSHDDYAQSIGGVQNIIGDECAEFQRRGWRYLHLCPAYPTRGLATDQGPGNFQFAIRLNGEALGRIDGAVLENSFISLNAKNFPCHWVIHHLMGHSPELLNQLIAVSNAAVKLFWAHDFFADCVGYTLMRNGLEFCNSPPPSSPACRVCAYGKSRVEHRKRIKKLIHAISPRIIAPSQKALELWSQFTGITSFEVEVLPPATLIVDELARRRLAGQRLRVAFIGAPQFHKGWASFERLAELFATDERYEFLQLGAPGPIPRQIEHVNVRVTAEDRDAMIRSINNHSVDVAVIWSLWPETYCFTAHEAIAAGAFVVHRRNQGHVDVAVHRWAPKAGIVLQNEESLHQYFRSGQIVLDVLKAHLKTGVLLPSCGSAESLAMIVAE